MPSAAEAANGAAAEQVEVLVDGDRAVEAPTVGVGAVVRVRGDVTALHVVVGDAVGGRGSERGGREDGQEEQGALHAETPNDHGGAGIPLLVGKLSGGDPYNFVTNAP